MPNRATFFAVFASMIASPALSCSCNQPLDPAAALQKADVVFLGMLISTKQAPARDAQGRVYPKEVDEHALFFVLKSWKGPRAGEVVPIRSEIGSGACGRSARNDPMWLEEIMPTQDGQPAMSRPMKISGTWIVYGYGKPPYGLSLCSRSNPTNVVGDEVRVLDELAREPPR